MKKAILSAAVAAAFTSNAFAYSFEGDWYTKVAVGVTAPDAGKVADFLANEIETDVGIVENAEFDHPRSYSINLGYRFNRFIAVEAGYTNLGETAEKFRYYSSFGPILAVGDRQGTIRETYRGEVSGSAKTLAAVLSTDASKALSAGVRVGYSFWNTQADVTYTYEEDGVIQISEDLEDGKESYFLSSNERRLSEDKNGQDPFYGVFVNWRINKWTYSLEHTLYATEDADPMMSSISLSMDY